MQDELQVRSALDERGGGSSRCPGIERVGRRVAVALAFCTLVASCGGGGSGGGGGGGGGGFFLASETPPTSPTDSAVTPTPSGSNTETPPANPPGAPVPTVPGQDYKIGGSVGGLLGDGLTLQLNGGMALSIAANGNFVFDTPVPGGADFTVAILSQPRNLTRVCSLSNRGPVQAGASSATDLLIDCSAPPARFAYVASSTGVAQYTIDPATGSLSALSVPLVPAGTGPVSIAVHPAGRFAYVANLNSNDVSAFAIDPNGGALVAIGSAVPAGAGAIFAAVEPTGRFLYVANVADSTISGFRIDAATGGLSAIAGSPFATAGSGPRFIAIDPTGRFAHVVNNGSNSAASFAIDSTTGALAPRGSIPTGVRPFAMALEPGGRFAYLTAEISQVVSGFAVDATSGLLSSTGGAASPGLPEGLALAPGGRFAYATDALGGTVSVFAIEAGTGSLARLPALSAATIEFPSFAAIAPDGRALYVAGSAQGVGAISQFALDASTGAVTPMATPSLVTGASVARSIALSR
ncbi:conserved hypothetical protein [Burkholderiales bacterium 8X]|nr:conserved hypothetical protein [Burkholderiales bacterium 8X]